jgi:outer membrane murein-binding lipoprotein Lpp
MAQDFSGQERGDSLADPFFPAAKPRTPLQPPSPPVAPPVVEPVPEPTEKAEPPRDRDVIIFRPLPQTEREAAAPAPAQTATWFLPVVWSATGAALLVLGVMIGRWTGPSQAPATNTPSTPSASPQEVRALDVEVHRLGPELKSLATRVEDLGQRIDKLPAPAPAPDFSPLRGRIDELARTVEPLSATPARLDTLQANLEGVSKTAETLHTRLDALDRTLARVQSDVKAATEPSWARAVELFKKGQYTAARDVFAALREARPDDARLWYYSALANGFASAKWDGETERLMNLGVSRERAGTPSASEIEAAFADLPAAAGKSWLEAYRKRGTRP